MQKVTQQIRIIHREISRIFNILIVHFKKLKQNKKKLNKTKPKLSIFNLI